MKVEELKNYVNEAISLRNPNKDKIAEYAERMEAGVTFPPVVIGHWPKSEKYGESGIVDGMHRLAAASEAKVKELAVENKKFASLEDALAYMYQANMAHGLPVTEGQRNKRILLLKQIDPKLTLEKIGEMFKIGKSSVDRILKGQQGEGKSGPKGANASKGQKSQKPKKASGVFKMITTLNAEFERKRPNQLAEVSAYISPATQENEDGEVDADKLEEITTLIAYLQTIVKLVS